MPDETSRMPVILNAQGEPTQLSGKVRSIHTAPSATKSWVDKRHPFYDEVLEDELRQRASYIATRKALAPFLVPHRFEGAEGKVKGERLPRAALGYGLRLQQPYVTELFGHIRATTATYSWGRLGERDEETTDPPTGGRARILWNDCTGKNESWKTFFERRVLEWMTTSPGGLIVVDSIPDRNGEQRTRLTLTPWSWVLDYRAGDRGLLWVRLKEVRDERRPKEPEDTKYSKFHVLYELMEDGSTLVSRYDKDGEPVAFKDGETERNMGAFVDAQGDPRLPITVFGYGEHVHAPMVGAGLLQGLDDIVIDLYNQMSETRESFRDASFGLLTYRGPDAQMVLKKLEQGTRFLPLGDHESAQLERVTGDSAEVQTGLSLLQAGLEAWRLSARRKVADAMERASAQSGVSLKAEFQLDSRPLLVELTERLDEIETETMRIVAQIAEVANTPEQIETMYVQRETAFNLEDDAERIIRMLTSAMDVFRLPAALKVELGMKWLEATGLVDLEKEVEGPEGEMRPLREIVEEGFTTLAESGDREQTQRSTFGGIPPIDL